MNTSHMVVDDLVEALIDDMAYWDREELLDYAQGQLREELEHMSEHELRSTYPEIPDREE